MADTLKFGPEWLRQLSGGNSVASPPPTPGLGGKFKLAEYRYGREEMLALFHSNYKAPEDLVNFPPVYVEEAQKPLALISLTEEEQRLMSQSVNSTTVLRSMGRGGPPVRGGRGSGDRGRGRGRGRGDGFPPRTQPYDQAENGGGFGRSRGQNKDGWEEVGKKYDRSFSARTVDDVQVGGRHPQFSRSLSSENWREKEETHEDDGGDWRRAGPQKERWSTRTNWREPIGRGGFDGERRQNGPLKDRTVSDADVKHQLYRRSRSSESWDTDDLPEWSVPGDDDMEELGTFDASGAFVTSHPKGFRNGESPHPDVPHASQSPSQPNTDLPPQGKETPREQRRDKKSQRSTGAPEVKQESASNHGNSQSQSPKPTVKPSHEPKRIDPSKSVQFGDVSQNINDSNSAPIEQKLNTMNVHRESVSGKKVKDGLHTTDNDPLDRLKEAAENMVAEMTAEDEENRLQRGPLDPRTQGVPLSHEESLKWFYRDPQGDVQGPFNPEEMAQWFSAGYFTMSLLVKRGCDERFQQLGELIKRWGRVPFLAGPTPPPLLNIPVTVSNTEAPVKQTPPPQQPTPTPPPPQDLLGMIPQQFILQQLMQQQMLMRQMQVQMMTQMQDQDSFKTMSPPQQQQMVMQMLMQTQPMFMQQLQQLQQLQQQQQQQQQNRLSPQPQAAESTPTTSHPAYHMPQPGPAVEGEGHPPGGQVAWSQPSSVWDLETPPSDMSPNTINQQQLEKLQAQQKAEEIRRKQEEEEERRRQIEMQRTQEELKRQQEEIAMEREKMIREKKELERQRQAELKRMEEIRRREEEEMRRQMEDERKREEERMREEQRRREEELAIKREEEARRKQEEERKRIIEEERRRQEEMHRQQLEEEHKKQEMLRQQELQRQQEEMLQEQQREEERQRELIRQQELQRQEQQKLQQEALRRLQQQQQEQLARMQLPPTAQWASQLQQRETSEGKSLAEIQQEEERQMQERERQLEIQRQQMFAIQQQQQQHQQQQQKSWGGQMTVNQAATNTLKSLLDIQEEQKAKQLDQNKKKAKQVQPTPPKNTAATMSTPSMWSNVASNGAQPSGWGGNAVWKTDKSGGGLGFWDDAVISSRPATKEKESGEFPALGGKKRNQQNNNATTNASAAAAVAAAAAANRNRQTKPKKEEDTVQKLFQSARPVDDFTQWCEKALAGLASSVDVPTFIAFLQEVDSPYEVHDYVRSYLGESGAAKEFGRQFLEKRSQYKQKARLERQQEEDSIWGPAPAVNPKEARSSNNNDAESAARNKNKKKKGKMQKIDKSILGFTVHADPTRVNAGEIENVD